MNVQDVDVPSQAPGPLGVDPLLDSAFNQADDDVRPCTDRDLARVAGLASEHAGLVAARGPGFLSLQDALSTGSLRPDELWRGHSPHPDVAQIAEDTERWMRDLGLWLTTTPHITRGASWMLPHAKALEVQLISKVMTLDWHLNDTQGRDLPTAGAPLAGVVLQVCGDLETEPAPGSAAHAVHGLFSQLRDVAPLAWFQHFLRCWRDHVELTHHELGIKATGQVPTVHSYIRQRCRTSGMVYCLCLVELGAGVYRDDLYRCGVGLASALERLNFLTAAVPALGNDLASFEKEVVDLGSSSNLVAVTALNRSQSLPEALTASAGIVADLIAEFVVLSRHVREHADTAGARNTDLLRYLDGLDNMISTVWTFQIRSLRYRYPDSIWTELNTTTANDIRHPG